MSIVTHAEVIRVLLLDALTWTPDAYWKLTVDAASISIVTIRPESRKVVAVNVSPT